MTPGRAVRGLRRRWQQRRLPQVRHLISVLDRVTPSTRLVSFDCFDTLIHRSCEPPPRVLELWAERIADICCLHGTQRSAQAVLDLRHHEEHALRRAATATDHEIPLTRLHHRLGQHLGLDAQLLLREEERCELATLYPADDAIALIAALRQRGLRIAVLSDMYWDEEYLRNWLQDLKLLTPEDILLVSGSRGASKHSGRLFQTLIAATGLDPQHILHIGDNPHADVVQARAQGLQALWLHDSHDLKRRQQLRSLAHQRGDSIQRLDACFPPPPPPQGLDAETYLIGRDVMGPAFYLFVTTTLRRIARLSAGKPALAAFLARDGYLPLRIAQLLRDKDDHWARILQSVELRYTHLSRRSTVAANPGDVIDRLKTFAAELSIHGTVAAVLRLMGASERDIAALALPCAPEVSLRSLGSPEVIATTLSTCPGLVELLGERQQQAREALIGYLRDHGIYGQPERTVHLIDLGWRSTIQRQLTALFADDPAMPPLFGHLLGNLITQRSLNGRGTSQLLPGVIVDAQRPAPGDHQVPRATSLLELGCQDNEGSTVGYARRAEQWQPVLGPAPDVDPRFREAIHAGVLARAQHLSQCDRQSVVAGEALIPAARQRIISFVTKPTAQQAKAFAQVHFDVDMGTDVRIPCIDQTLGLSHLLPPTRLLRAIRQVAWVEGSLKASRMPFGQHIHRAWMFFK